LARHLILDIEIAYDLCCSINCDFTVVIGVWPWLNLAICDNPKLDMGKVTIP
jgi:hypothetical protein